MAIAFNEQANEYIENKLSFQERKHLWCSNLLPKTRAISKTTSLPRTNRKITSVLINSREDVRTRHERRRRIRSFVRLLVDEHNSLRAMGVNDDMSLFRLSASCSKTDVINAQRRAGSYRRSSMICPIRPSTTSILYGF